jgi:hypothetical protein
MRERALEIEVESPDPEVKRSAYYRGGLATDSPTRRGTPRKKF